MICPLALLSGARFYFAESVVRRRLGMSKPGWRVWFAFRSLLKSGFVEIGKFGIWLRKTLTFPQRN